jgi:replicative DNA helicase
MKAEIKLFNAVCANKDIQSILSPDIEKMITSTDVYNTIVKYYHRYSSVPDFSIIQDKHRDLLEVKTSGDTKFYVDELRNEFITNEMRNIIAKNASRGSELGPSELLEKITSELTVLSRESGVVRDVNITDITDAVGDYKERARLSEENGGNPGISTGISYFDRAYPTGLSGGHLIVIIGWSGHGKSLMSTYLACKAWEQGYKPMIVSLEMSPEQVRDRVYTMLASGLFSNKAMSRGDIDVDSFETWGRKNVEDRNDFIIVSSEGQQAVTPLMVQSKIDQYRPDLVIMDYQQLFDASDGNANEVAKNKSISRDFKRMAISNNIPIINLSQATQSDVSDLESPPLIEQVAWSKSIQHDADLAIAVHKPPNSNVMEVLARKSRHGELFMFWIDTDIDKGVWTPTLDVDFE